MRRSGGEVFGAIGRLAGARRHGGFADLRDDLEFRFAEKPGQTFAADLTDGEDFRVFTELFANGADGFLRRADGKLIGGAGFEVGGHREKERVTDGDVQPAR